MLKRGCATIVLFILAVTVLIAAPSTVNSLEEECKGIVTYVVDGDTIDVKSVSGFKSGKTIRVRFADINAPELNTLEGKIAKSALFNLIYGKMVILDIDDVYVYDKYGRVVAVVYLPVNATTLMNVNYWLVLNGYARITNYRNEFNPYTWTLYERIG